MLGISMNIANAISDGWSVVIALFKPMLFANYVEVSFINANPPIIIPADWHPAWIVLIYFEFSSYFKHRASNEISWRLNPKFTNISKMARVLAWDWSVKKEAIKIDITVKSWLVSIQNFLFP